MKANQKNIDKIYERNRAGMIQMLPTVGFAVILLYAVMYIGTYTNGTIGSQLIDTYNPNSVYNATGNNEAGSWRTTFQNGTVNTLNNMSGDYDNNTEIISVAAIVTILTVPLMAIAGVRRLF